jgi:hypothetical protein
MTPNRENEDTGTGVNRDLSKEGGTRAGGNVVTKGPSQDPPEEESTDTRAGGNVVTKGSSK